jgi:hypothetical protein
MGHPVQLGFVHPGAETDALFQKYLEDVKRNREAGGSITHLSKRDIERWGFFPPVGARVQVMEVDIPSQDWIEYYENLRAKQATKEPEMK